MNQFVRAARPILVDSLGLIVFAILLALHVNLIVSTLCGASLAIGVVIRSILQKHAVGAIQWMSLALVLVSAGATLLTHDPRFMMAKGTIAYCVAGGLMMKQGWMTPYMPEIARNNAPDLVLRFGLAWAGLMFLTALVNLWIAVLYPEWWTTFVGIFPLGSKAILFTVQFVIMRATLRARLRAVPSV